MMMAAFGVGAVAISAIMSVAGDFSHKGLITVVSGTIFALGMVGVAFSDNFILTLVLIVIIGMAGVSWMNTTNTLIQTSAADEMRGRVMNFFMIGTQMMSLGWLIGGVLATVLSNEGALVISAVIFGGFGLFVYIRSKELRNIE